MNRIATYASNMGLVKELLNLGVEEIIFEVDGWSRHNFESKIKSASDIKLAKLDPIITLNKSMLAELLDVEVPDKAVDYHLAVLNAASNILADLQAMRVVFIDPVRSLSAIAQFKNDTLILKTATDNIATFFINN